MTRRFDAIIIGAGVIGAATAYELCKRGYKTLNIDKLPASGYGPTSNSCAIVRAHYSSLEGVAMAYEGFAYWPSQSWYGSDAGKPNTMLNRRRLDTGQLRLVIEDDDEDHRAPPRAWEDGAA